MSGDPYGDPMSYPLPLMNTRNSPLITALAAVELVALLNIRFSPQMELKLGKLGKSYLRPIMHS